MSKVVLSCEDKWALDFSNLLGVSLDLHSNIIVLRNKYDNANNLSIYVDSDKVILEMFKELRDLWISSLVTFMDTVNKDLIEYKITLVKDNNSNVTSYSIDMNSSTIINKVQ